MISYTVYLVHGKILGIEVFGKRPERWYLEVGIYIDGAKFCVHTNPLGRGKDVIVNSTELVEAIVNLDDQLTAKVKEIFGISNPTLGDILRIFPRVTVKSHSNFTRRS